MCGRCDVEVGPQVCNCAGGRASVRCEGRAASVRSSRGQFRGAKSLSQSLMFI